MSSDRSRLHRETLRQESEERQAARVKRTPLAQLKVLLKRGVSVPAITGKDVKALDLNEVSGKYCKEVMRLVKAIRGESNSEK
ncbi:MAG TPA: hypothetical protein VMV86_04655 [Methanosarcinales archaeon]|nr:hypothetical protein [Methanosarcinales archaeon]